MKLKFRTLFAFVLAAAVVFASVPSAAYAAVSSDDATAAYAESGDEGSSSESTDESADESGDDADESGSLGASGTDDSADTENSGTADTSGEDADTSDESTDTSDEGADGSDDDAESDEASDADTADETEDDETEETSSALAITGTLSGLSSTVTVSSTAAAASVTSYSYSYTYTSLKSATLSPSSVSVDDVLDAAAEFITSQEGSYSSVNADDNGALSLGILQWHGANALVLMRLIVAADNESAYDILGSSLYNEIIKSTTTWSTRTLSSSEVTKFSNCISSTAGKKIQDKLLDSYISIYINRATNLGIKNAAALVIYADLENQRGSSGALKTAAAAAELAGSYSKVTANEMLITSICCYSTSSESLYKSFVKRRLAAYEYVIGLGWTYCNSGDYLIAYSSSSATTTATSWLQYALNTVDNAGLTVDGSYGTKTKAAVVSFQSSRGLDADGIPGQLTITQLIVELYEYLTTGSVSSSSSSSASSTLAISSYNYPSSVIKGNSYTIKGTIKSNYSITKVAVYILNSSGSTVYSGSATPNAKSYSLSNLASKLKFAKLSTGTYTYKVTATDSKTSKTLVKKSFTVVAASTLKISSYNYPSKITKGNSYSIYGTVKSNYKITKVTVKVINSSGKTVLSASATPNAKSYSIKKLDAKIKFGTLASGKYTYKVTATDTQKSKTLVSKTFNVTTIKISSYNYPSSITKGKSFSIYGMVKSSYKIKKVKVSVINSSGKTVLSASATPNAKSYSIKKLDAKITFGKLSKGTYTYKITATDTKTSVTVLSKKFKVK